MLAQVATYSFSVTIGAVLVAILWQLRNLHQIPETKRHIQFEKWARQYGSVYSLMLGSRVMVVLSSDQAVKDLIDKRGVVYSLRPEFYIAQDIISGGLRPNNEVWKMARKFAHRILGVAAARSYVPYQDLENKAMLLGFLERPKDFIDHLRRYTVSLTTQMTFGFRTASLEDPRSKEAFDLFDRESELIGSRTASLLDLIPVLRRLPEIVLPIKREGRLIHEREMKLFRVHYLNAKKGLQDGTTKPSICVDLVKIQKEERLSDDLAAYVGGSLLQAGSETTASILVGFIQAMVIFPEVAQRAQYELDQVCGERLPDLNDEPNLPYIRACAKESLRWMPGFLLGVPHTVTQDDTYLGNRIPKDSMVILNVWAIHNDPKRHPSPRQFEPMQYIDDDQTSIDAENNPDPSKRDHFVFGAGRRRCGGMHIADRSLFLAISHLLCAFDFHKAVDPDTGEEITPDMNDLMEGNMVLPNSSPAKIEARSAQKAQAVRDEWEGISRILDEQSQWKAVPEGLIWKDEQLPEVSGLAL